MEVGDEIEFEIVPPNHGVHMVEDFSESSQDCPDGEDLTNGGSSMECTADKCYILWQLLSNKTYYLYCPNENHCQDGMQLLVTVLPIGTTPTPSTPGSYNDPYDQMVIKQCEIGKYQDEPGQTECKQIQDCLPGTFQISNNTNTEILGSTFDRDCRPCIGEKLYTNEINSQTCSSCPSKQKANEENTGCVPDSDEDTVEAWIWILVGGGSGILFIVAVVLIVRSRQRRAGKFSTSKGSNSMIRALIY